MSIPAQGEAQHNDNYVVLDIEIAPENFEDEQIKEYLMDKNFPRKMHPLFSRIILIGLKPANKETELFYPKDEKDLLTRFWSRLSELKPAYVVTFNGYNFDIPFIEIRSKIKEVQPTIGINQNKYKMDSSNHIDCMQMLSSSQTFLNVALDISCRVLGIPVPEERVAGEEIPKLYAAGKFDILKEHCKQDVEITEQLYLKLKG
jgi:DNA polymerase elongation subunit (family B)